MFFATSNAAARRAGMSDLGYTDVQAMVTCKRAPWADAYARNREVPAGVAIANGWHFEDAWNGDRIDEDYLADTGLNPRSVIGTMNSLVFACKKHEEKFHREARKRKSGEKRALEMLKRILKRRFPESKSSESGQHAHASLMDANVFVEQASVRFSWPTQTIADAEITIARPRSDFVGAIEPRFLVCSGDIEAFEAYTAAHPKKKAKT